MRYKIEGAKNEDLPNAMNDVWRTEKVYFKVREEAENGERIMVREEGDDIDGYGGGGGGCLRLRLPSPPRAAVHATPTCFTQICLFCLGLSFHGFFLLLFNTISNIFYYYYYYFLFLNFFLSFCDLSP